MIAPLFSAFVMMLPLNPGAEHAALATLFASGVPSASREAHDAPLLIRDWSGSECRSSFAIRVSAAKTLRTSIDWSGGRYFELTRTGSHVYLTGGFSDATDVGALDLTFATEVSARRAEAAFRGLHLACTPQR